MWDRQTETWWQQFTGDGINGDRFVDAETGSVWNILGRAVKGPMAGEQLTPIVHANHFWFSWGAFRPDTKIYPGARHHDHRQ